MNEWVWKEIVELITPLPEFKCAVCGKKRWQTMETDWGMVCEMCILKAFKTARGKYNTPHDTPE